MPDSVMRKTPDEVPAGPLVDMVIFLCCAAGAIAMLYGFWCAGRAVYHLARALLP